MHHFTLEQLVARIRRSISVNFPEPVWLQAELSQVKQSRGHWYLELVQKEERTDQLSAQIGAVIWKSTAASIQKKRHSDLDNLLIEGRQMLLEAEVDFHPVYGLKLTIRDIDTEFSEGLLAKQKAETIAKLVQSGSWEKNKSIQVPLVIRRIALISNESAAGYADFIEHLKENPYGYVFETTLFPTALQGQGVITEVPARIFEIQEKRNDFDAVVIIRGGGSKLDLSAFDNYLVANAIANCPLPVITGIGHETDDTVSDMVAAIRMKTPTATATYIIEKALHFESKMIETLQRIQSRIQDKWLNMDSRLHQLLERIRSSVFIALDKQNNSIRDTWQQIITFAHWTCQQELSRIDHAEKLLSQSDPVEVIKKGYTILIHEGQMVTDPSLLPQNANLTNIHHKGRINSIFTDYEREKKEWI